MSAAARVVKDYTAEVPVRMIGTKVEYSDHVRVATLWNHAAEQIYMAVCFTCHPERSSGWYPVGADRKYYRVAQRDAQAHTHAEHGGA